MAVSHRGAISFGMVHIPVGLYTATQDDDIHFNQLCKEDGSRVKYKKVCASCGKEVSSGDIIKGFEYELGKYVTMTDDDFEKAKTEKDKTIQILHFADLQSIRPVYFDKTYHAVPEQDGELAVMEQGKPNFFAIQSRSLMSTPRKIQLVAQQQPATFVAFDLLYLDNHPTTELPLTERKRLLREVTLREDAHFVLSRIIERGGIQFFELAKAQNLEGIVAKRRESKYYFDKRTRDWIKIKYLQDEDFVVCGYLCKVNRMNALVLGQYQDGQLVCKGHVTLGVGGESFRKIRELPKKEAPPFPVSSENEGAVWVEPSLVCTVQYMMKTEHGGMRQPVFKGLREDKEPSECG